MVITRASGWGTARTNSTKGLKQWSIVFRNNQCLQETKLDEKHRTMPTGTIIKQFVRDHLCKDEPTREVLQEQLKKATAEIILLQQVIEGKDATFHSIQEAWIMSEASGIQQQVTNFVQEIFSNNGVDDDNSSFLELKIEFLETYCHSYPASERSSRNSESSESDEGSDTDATSICESDISPPNLLHAHKNLNKAFKFVQKLKHAFVERSKQLDGYKARLQSQLCHRQNDYQKVLEYSTEMKHLSENYDEMEKGFKQDLASKEQELASKEQELASKEQELAAKEQKLQSLIESNKDFETRISQSRSEQENMLAKKDDELERTRKEAMQSLERAGSEHVKQQKNLMKATSVIQDNMKSEIGSLQGQVKCLEAELIDNGKHTQSEIQNLTTRNQALQEEVNMLKQTPHQGYPSIEQVRTVLEHTEKVRKESIVTKQKLHIANNDNAALLDDMQRERDQVNIHLENERTANKDCAALECKVAELAEAVSQKNLLIEQLSLETTDEPCRTTSSEAVDAGTTHSGGASNSSALHAALQQTDELRGMLRSEQEAKAVVIAKASKLEDELFRREVEEQFTTVAQHDAKQQICDLEQTCEMYKQRISSLENNLMQSTRLPEDDRTFFAEYISNSKQEIDQLKAKQRPLEEELKNAKDEAQTIEDRLDTKIRVANDVAEHYATAHFATLKQNELLHERIAAFMQEKGENYYIESDHPYDKVVADRNALRYACDNGIPPGVKFEDGWPGSVPATYVALRKLRPLGWRAISDLGKVWLTPLVKPFTEEDALEREEAKSEKDRMAYRKKMGFPIGQGLVKPKPENAASRANPRDCVSQNQLKSKAKPQRCATKLRGDDARPKLDTSAASGNQSNALSLSYDSQANNFRSKNSYHALTLSGKQKYQRVMVEEGFARRKEA